MASTAHIFEDRDTRWTRQSPVKNNDSRKNHARTPSVGAILRGRKLRENDPSRTEPVRPSQPSRERPLRERHINSPPNPQRVPLKGVDDQPTLHKKTKSAVSLKSLVKDKKSDGPGPSPLDDVTRGDGSPKKSKVAAGFGNLLRKRSTKGVREQAVQQQQLEQSRSVPSTPAGNSDSYKSPIWEQFATQPFEDQFGRVQSPVKDGRTIAQEIDLYTPKESKGHDRPQLNASQSYNHSSLYEKPPQRPFLEHKGSRSSIFKEEGMDNASPIATESPDASGNTSSYFQYQRPATGSRTTSTDKDTESSVKKTSKVMTAFGGGHSKCFETALTASESENLAPLSPQEIDSAFEAVLDSRNIPQNMRDKMRSMDLRIKADFVKSHRVESGSSQASSSIQTPEDVRPTRSRAKSDAKSVKKGEVEVVESKRSRSRPRSRVFTLSKGEKSPSKKSSSSEDKEPRSRPHSLEILRPGSSRSFGSTTSLASKSSGRPDSAGAAGDFVHYLCEVRKPELVEVGKMHKLRILLRNETVAWTDSFISCGGMDEVVSLLYRITEVEWREEHEDTLLHETLLCLKALCTTDLALRQLTVIESTLFPKLLSMLFDTEKKGPSEFSTRAIIMSLLFMHLSAATSFSESGLVARTRKVLHYLEDPSPEDGSKPLEFIQKMHVPRPYRLWCKEIVNVTKEVFWIFLHHLNVIPLTNPSSSSSMQGQTYLSQHFPPPRPPHPAAPYVGGVEWEATLYLSDHLNLLNGVIASLPTRDARNQLRQELKDSGFEKVMGGTMRTCKEKFYGHLHDGLRTWVAAAWDDAWIEGVQCVREGPPREEVKSKASSPKKGAAAAAAPPALKVELPNIGGGDQGWL